SEHALHAEIRHRFQRYMGMRLLEPGGSLVGFLPGIEQCIDFRANVRIGRDHLQLALRDSLQDNPWIVSKRPKLGVEAPPEFVRRRFQAQRKSRASSVNAWALWIGWMTCVIGSTHGCSTQVRACPAALLITLPTIACASAWMRRRWSRS